MKKFLNKHELSIKLILCIFIVSLITTTFEYLFLNTFIGNMILTFSVLLASFYYSYKNSFKENLKGYELGLRNGIKIIIFILLFNIITFSNVGVFTLIYYLLILLVSTIAGIISKNKSCSR